MPVCQFHKRQRTAFLELPSLLQWSGVIEEVTGAGTAGLVCFFRGSRAVLLSSKLVTSAWTQILMRLLLLYIIYRVLLFQGQMSKDFVVGFFHREMALASWIISVKWRMEIEARKVRRRADRKISSISNNKSKCPDDLFLSFSDAFWQQLNIKKRR